MATKFVRVKNKLHGGVTSLPETALPNLPDWEPVEGPLPDRPKPNRAPRNSTVAAPAASAEQE